MHPRPARVLRDGRRNDGGAQRAQRKGAGFGGNRLALAHAQLEMPMKMRKVTVLTMVVMMVLTMVVVREPQSLI